MLNTFVKIFVLTICCSLMDVAFTATNVEGIQVYQKNLHLSLEHKQKLAADITRYRNADNLWDVLREDLTLPHYENNPLVQDKIEWYMNNQDFLLRAASRAAPYLYYILQEIKKRHLPTELVLLPIIESGYNPFSLSNVGAAGIWQLMPETASGLGIRQDTWYDGRRDIIASTRAALNYLLYLQSFFEGNWLLATAAYNTGEGNVLAAIRRNIRNGINTDFWSLPVAQQTRDYVPSLLALAAIISHPRKYPIYLPPVRNAPYLAQIDVGKQINLKYAATLAGISYKKLTQLNPGFSRASTSSKGPYKLVLPIENIEQFSENLARTPFNKPMDWVHYKVKTGDTLLFIAKKFNTTTIALRNMNHLKSDNLHTGTNLLIPTNPKAISITEGPIVVAAKDEKKKETPFVTFKTASSRPTVSKPRDEVRSSEKKYTLQPGDTIYMVRDNDSLESIAKRFHISSKSLEAANDLATKILKPGHQLIIPTHATNKDNLPNETIYIVRKGDTIEKIASKFGTTPAAIRITNLIDNFSLREGEQVTIPARSPRMSG